MHVFDDFWWCIAYVDIWMTVSVTIICCDFKTDFSSVPHKRLLKKISACGIRRTDTDLDQEFCNRQKAGSYLWSAGDIFAYWLRPILKCSPPSLGLSPTSFLLLHPKGKRFFMQIKLKFKVNGNNLGKKKLICYHVWLCHTICPVSHCPALPPVL